MVLHLIRSDLAGASRVVWLLRFDPPGHLGPDVLHDPVTEKRSLGRPMEEM